jgi:cephalosporin-C deacetylase-like acetyl esterase
LHIQNKVPGLPGPANKSERKSPLLHRSTDSILQSPGRSTIGTRTEAIMTPSRWQEIERVHGAALQYPLEERDAFLRRACGDDASLRRMVELMLEAGTGDGLHDLPDLRIADALSDNTETLEPGKQLGPYRIEGVLGAGGMGTVYRATDTRLGRPVAIKISSSIFDERFKREARSIASLNNPHICTLYDVSANYMVMELVEGETLRDRLKRAPSVESGMEIAKQVLDALRAAHDAGIVHRDLKPANIMVRSDGYVKVLDFGLAKQIPGSEDVRTEPTGTLPGQVPGTPAYMSPEQISAQKVDQRSDLFAFGIILYEILTGRHPWVRQSQIDTLHAILHDDPAPIPAGSVPQPVLTAVVQKLLRKNPDERYSSAGEVLAALAAVPVSEGGAQDRTNPGVSAILRRDLGARSLRSLFTSRTAMITAALLLVLGAGAFGVREHVRASRIRWVEKEAAPEIARLINGNRRLAARTLYDQARRYAPDSAALIALAEGVAGPAVSFRSNTSGAQVYISDYMAAAGDDLAQWRLLGTTPLQTSQIPRWGYYRVRALKEGFAPLTQTFFPTAGLSSELTLQPATAVPQGMVWVPAGPAAGPAVTIPPPIVLPGFWMDTYEVTNREFKKFVDAGGYQKPEYWKQSFVRDGKALSWQQAMEEFRDTTRKPGPASWQFGIYPEDTAAMPVGGVSWYEAAAYAEFAGKSLPTLYEWFRAAGVPSANSEILSLSNFGGKGPAVVGTYRGMAPFGTYDMAGNVSEWTANAASAGNQRYFLGGAWNQEPYHFAGFNAADPMARKATIGFRCIRRVTAPPPESLGPITQNTSHDLGRPVDDRTYKIFSDLQGYDKTAIVAKVEQVDESSPYWRRQTVTFPAAYGGERMMVHLFLPRNSTPPYQAVVVFGGSNVFTTTRIQDFQFPYEFLLRAGRAAIFPVFSGTLERGPSSFRLPINQARERALRWPKDVGQTIDYLETRPDIDARRIGFYGVSSGALQGICLIALDHRFKAAALSSGGLSSFAMPREADPWNYAPRVRIPVLMVNGRDDFISPVETSQKPLFNALGTRGADKRYTQYEGGHANLVSRPDLIGEILEWFDRYLGPVKVRP